MRKREGRITIDESGRIIGSSVEHIRPGDPVRIEDRDGNVLYRSKFDPEKYKKGLWG